MEEPEIQQSLGEVPVVEDPPVAEAEVDEGAAQEPTPVPTPSPKAERVLMRATVYLQGLPRGHTALVDPTDPYMASMIKRGRLVPAEA